MIYCKKCARLLDEDVRVCPYCQNEDEHFNETGNAFGSIPSAEPDAEPDDALSKLQAINDRIAEQQANTPERYGSSETSPNPADNRIDSQKEFIDPRSIKVEGRGMDTAEEKPGTGLYVGMVLLSIFIPIAGFIVGIVYMTNKKALFRKMGLVMLLISIAITLVSAIACCAFFYAIGTEVAPYIY